MEKRNDKYALCGDPVWRQRRYWPQPPHLRQYRVSVGQVRAVPLGHLLPVAQHGTHLLAHLFLYLTMFMLT